MPERPSRTETWRAGSLLKVGPMALLPIERVVINVNRGKARAWFTVAKEPFALVVRDSGGVRAVATTASAVSLDELRQRIPELETLLTAP